MNLAASRLITANELIHNGRAAVSALILSSDGGNADCDIYDGTNSKGTKKFHLEAKSGETFPVSFPLPVLFDYGIYAVVSSSSANLMINYNPIQPANLARAAVMPNQQ